MRKPMTKKMRPSKSRTVKLLKVSLVKLTDCGRFSLEALAGALTNMTGRLTVNTQKACNKMHNLMADSKSNPTQILFTKSVPAYQSFNNTCD